MNNKNNFSKNVEKLVNPISVASIHFLQGFMKYLPIGMQNKIMENSAKNNPIWGLSLSLIVILSYMK